MMPWTASARADYARPAERYATDLTDGEFALMAPHLPAPNRLGRPREVDLREVLDALFYLVRTGCPWRLLPKDFPPKSTVFDYFRRLWEDGTWPTLHALLVMAARERAGAGRPRPRRRSVDSQSVRTTEAGGPTGYDAGKKVTGRKRHTSWSTRSACCWCSSSTPPTSRIATGWRWSAAGCAGASPGCG
jgi:transposase